MHYEDFFSVYARTCVSFRDFGGKFKTKILIILFLYGVQKIQEFSKVLYSIKANKI